MTILILDTENTTHQKGNPFSRKNKCCAFSYLYPPGKSTCIKVEYDSPVDHGTLRLIQDICDQADLIVGFNLKYDLHWLRRYGIILPNDVRFWCCQSAQFVIRNQSEKYPSLNSSCLFWGLGEKLDIVAKEYWDKGIDTPQIPWDVLYKYACQDVDLTYSLFKKQEEYLLRQNPPQQRLISLLNQDLEVLAEMEWNGLRYDMETSYKLGVELEREINKIDENIRGVIGNHPFNFNSNDHLSAILYGGTIEFERLEPYKTKQGITRNHHVKWKTVFPRLVNPIANSEYKKPGVWSTDEATLKELNPANKMAQTIIKGMQKRARLEKLVSTYYKGFPKKIEEMDWVPGEIHGQLNQCVAITGRLSSSGPNQQNIPPEVYELVRTRF